MPRKRYGGESPIKAGTLIKWAKKALKGFHDIGVDTELKSSDFDKKINADVYLRNVAILDREGRLTDFGANFLGEEVEFSDADMDAIDFAFQEAKRIRKPSIRRMS